MAFKINISEKSGKTYKLESEAKGLIDKKIGETIDGKILSDDLEGYELEITGASDKSGFPASKEVEGIGRKRVLLTYGTFMKKKPKREGKKKLSNNKPKGLRLRKTLRGNTISDAMVQINFKVAKAGAKTLEDIYNPKVEEAAPAAK